MLLSTLPSPALLHPAPGYLLSFVPWLVCGAALCVAAICAIWASLERKERRALHSQNERLSSACLSLTEHHYRERVAAEERHLLAHDSSVRNVLEHLERMLFGKPKP